MGETFADRPGDRDEIDEVHNLYFFAMDARRFELLSRVFAPDIEYTARMIGLPVANISGFPAVDAAIRMVAHYRTSHHGTRNRLVEFTGENDAVAVLHAMDALLDTNPRAGDVVAGHRVIQHGLRYEDRLVRRPEGWRIRERKLTCLWQTVAINPAYQDLPPGS